MFTSFSTALSALDATSTAIDVVGNNLANMDTPGFKTSEVCFRDLVTQSLGAGLGDTQVGFGTGTPFTVREFTQGAIQSSAGGLDAAVQGDGFFRSQSLGAGLGDTQVGFGTGTPFTVREFTQGAIQSSAGVLDAAVQGDGFFVVHDSTGNQYYTRAGNFETDKNGNLLTDTGNMVQGWTTIDPTTGQVDTNGPIGNIVVPVESLKNPTPTSSITMDLNLNSASTADSTSNFSAPMTVYDSLGTSHVLTLSFQKTGANAWSYSVSIPGSDLVDPTGSTIATGSLTFDANGQLTDPANGSPIAFTVPDLADGAASGQTITWNPYNSDGSGKIDRK